MRNKQYQLNIGGIAISISLPYEVEVDEACKPFLTEAGKTDISIVFDQRMPDGKEESIIRERGPVVWKGYDYYRVERAWFSSKINTSVILSESDLCNLRGSIYPGSENVLSSLDRILGLLELEVVWTRFHALNLHSSLIRYRGKGILFSAPSGTGKSTQAALWEQYRRAEIINGDRALIRKTSERWIAYGSPFAGSSGIYKNENVPIQMIVILRQGKDNQIEWLSPSEAFKCLYKETIVPRWNDSAHVQIMDMLNEIVDEIPICCFHCTPDESAVEVLERFLQEVNK